jgi:phosphoglycerate dehydrogenase-like enzyme
MGKLKAYVLPSQYRLNFVCPSECKQLINENFDVTWNESAKEEYTEQQLEEIISDAEVILTTWKSPGLTDKALAKAAKLRYIGHAAGSVKGRLPRQAFEQGVRVFSAAPLIAQSVGEYCLGAMLAMLRALPRGDAAIRQGKWKDVEPWGKLLTGKKVGIVSAGSTARVFIQLLQPFRCDIVVYDPYLSNESADKLGVRSSTLEEVMSCPIISVHAPNIPATSGMITAEHLRHIPDGALLVNSSRAGVFRWDDLLAELGTGRFYAAMDVFDKEPVPIESPLIRMDNVFLTPHLAGHTIEGNLSLMPGIVEDILRAERNVGTLLEIKAEQYDILA